MKGAGEEEEIMYPAPTLDGFFKGTSLGVTNIFFFTYRVIIKYLGAFKSFNEDKRNIVRFFIKPVKCLEVQIVHKNCQINV